MPAELQSWKELANYLGVSVRTVSRRQAGKSGRIPHSGKITMFLSS